MKLGGLGILIPHLAVDDSEQRRWAAPCLKSGQSLAVVSRARRRQCMSVSLRASSMNW